MDVSQIYPFFPNTDTIRAPDFFFFFSLTDGDLTICAMPPSAALSFAIFSTTLLPLPKFLFYVLAI